MAATQVASSSALATTAPSRQIVIMEQPITTPDPVEPEATYDYQLERGPLRCDNPTAAGLYLCGSSLLALHRETLADRQASRDARRLLHAALSIYLGSRPLRTREVSRRLAAFTTAGGNTPIGTPQADGSEGVHGN